MRKNMGKKIALGATGVALTAGAVAAGAIMMNKKTRNKVTRDAKKAFGTMKAKTIEFAEKNEMPAITPHKVSRKKTKTS